MKSNSFLIASLVILVAMGAITVSCKKEQSNGFRKAEIIVEESPNVKTGEDDEDPVIQGKVKKKNGFAPIDSAYVETVSNATRSTVVASYTNSLGDFVHQVPAGTYYFRVTVPGGSPFETDTVRVYANTIVTILVD